MLHFHCLISSRLQALDAAKRGGRLQRRYEFDASISLLNYALFRPFLMMIAAAAIR